MFDISLADFLLLGLTCCLAAGFAVGISALFGRYSNAPTSSAAPDRDEPVWLFQNGLLVDANQTALQFLDGSQFGADAWQDICTTLRHRFPDLPQDLDQLDISKLPLSLPAVSPTDRAAVHIENVAGTTRIELISNDTTDANLHIAFQKLSVRVEVLGEASQKSPYAAWRSDSSGQVLWSNAAYDSLLRKVRGDNSSDTSALFSLAPEQSLQTSQRVSLTDQVFHKPYWFEVSSIPVGADTMHYAGDINAVVAAEIAQRNFVQTLAKTFAQLSTGLAIFDRKRQLVLFNPALVDLTGLSAEFLSIRPDLLSFFDRLRDARIMPEPKSYSNWRSQIAEVVAAASDGRYQETWSLPSGLTYQITGRPHPDGALAFLIEDVSAEVSLTRRFREQLEMGQSVIDQQENAIAVFSPQGNLALSNAAFGSLWGLDPANGFANLTLGDASGYWQEKCTSSPFFERLKVFVGDFGPRKKWASEISLKSGAKLHCHVTPLPSGETLVNFSSLSERVLSSAVG